MSVNPNTMNQYVELFPLVAPVGLYSFLKIASTWYLSLQPVPVLLNTWYEIRNNVTANVIFSDKKLPVKFGFLYFRFWYFGIMSHNSFSYLKKLTKIHHLHVPSLKTLDLASERLNLNPWPSKMG